MKRIGVLTSGGDSPGMNAAIRSVTRAAIKAGHEVYGIYYGYKGIIERKIEKFDRFSVSEKISRGGTFLRSARYPQFKDPEVRQQAKEILSELGIEYLVVIGGDGSFTGAKLLSDIGIKCIGIPGTIDNDLNYTDFTLGFDTAVNTVIDAVDKLRDTSASHQRCNLVEVMGRHCGDIAIHAALATGAKYLITPETGFDKQHLLDDLKEQSEHGIRYSIVMVTENMMRTNEMAQEIQLVTGIETRSTILGHVQRGGSPTAFDRKLGIELGKRAVELIDQDRAARCVGVDGIDIIDMDITEALTLPAKDKSELIETFIATK